MYLVIFVVFYFMDMLNGTSTFRRRLGRCTRGSGKRLRCLVGRWFTLFFDVALIMVIFTLMVAFWTLSTPACVVVFFRQEYLHLLAKFFRFGVRLLRPGAHDVRVYPHEFSSPAIAAERLEDVPPKPVVDASSLHEFL